MLVVSSGQKWKLSLGWNFVCSEIQCMNYAMSVRTRAKYYLLIFQLEFKNVSAEKCVAVSTECRTMLSFKNMRSIETSFENLNSLEFGSDYSNLMGSWESFWQVSKFSCISSGLCLVSTLVYHCRSSFNNLNGLWEVGSELSCVILWALVECIIVYSCYIREDICKHVFIVEEFQCWVSDNKVLVWHYWHRVRIYSMNLVY